MEGQGSRAWWAGGIYRAEDWGGEGAGTPGDWRTFREKERGQQKPDIGVVVGSSWSQIYSLISSLSKYLLRAPVGQALGL